MQLSRLALFPSFLTAFIFTGCHHTEIQPLPGSAHPAYAITDLGPGLPSDVNNRGQVVGEYAAGVFPNRKGFPYLHGCLWDRGKRIEMPTLGGWYSNAVKISDSGWILGTSTIAGRERPRSAAERLCLWDGHTLTDLNADPRFHGTTAVHITKSGAIFAASPPQGLNKQFHLWLYPLGFGPGIRRDVGVIGGPEIKPLFINDSGMVVGTWDTKGKGSGFADHHGFVWHRGDKKWQDIGTFGGSQSEPAGVNDAGQVAGTADLPYDPTLHQSRSHAFLWENNRLKDLGTLPRSNFSHAYAINNKGQVVGFCQVEGNGLDFRPLLWEHGQIKDLSRLIPSGTPWGNIGGAEGINDRGQIVGDGSLANPTDHYAHGYLLTPR